MNTEELREIALNGLAAGIADENIGIYPQAVSGGLSPYEKRSEWQEGWNACVIKRAGMVVRISDWLDAVPAESKAMVEDWLLSERIHLYAGDTIKLFVNCSDTFAWGCADAEDITFAELPELAECYRLSTKYGGELWACRKRGMRPQTACYRECYPRDEWPLFDAAGPYRIDSDGAGRASL